MSKKPILLFGSLAVALVAVVLYGRWGVITDGESEIHRTEQARTLSRLERLARVVDSIAAERVVLPRSRDELEVALTAQQKDALLNDGWGKPVNYQVRDDGYELRSGGADGIVGSNDDVVVLRTVRGA